ncbi:unnamed protein product [Strongylus vulgaris]|uniref:Uncharacterized protein n=1 Tax=Strongylus vulgaris TaxID=40348 RepID=A0A3P7JGS0_STRVU|nr:unnamed protein product [Strongylus vulgaris]
MNIDTAIPPPKRIGVETHTGYDIPRDTIIRDGSKQKAIFSARSARQSVESNGSLANGMNDYLIPSTSTKLVPDSPRIVITSPDDDPLPSPFSLKVDKDVLSRINHHKRHAVEPPPSTDRSFLLAVVVAAAVVLVVILLIYLYFKLG